VFTGGRYWLSDKDVEQILTDNDYQPVSQPRVGDVVVYREGTRISHTAVVRTVAADGLVLVEGKWGWMGTFLHPPGGSCYGLQFAYYRGPRESHLLVGLGGKPGPTARSSDVPVPTGTPTTSDTNDEDSRR
jgi:hypothetical protein